MQDTFEQVREQIHQIRNYLSPLVLKLDNLDHQLVVNRKAFEARTTELETKISVTSLRLTEQEMKIDALSEALALQEERIKRIELLLKMQKTLEKAQGPVHEDKLNPDLPPVDWNL
jgi:uncharacterized coiled-coil protein SlyX